MGGKATIVGDHTPSAGCSWGGWCWSPFPRGAGDSCSSWLEETRGNHANQVG